MLIPPVASSDIPLPCSFMILLTEIFFLVLPLSINCAKTLLEPASETAPSGPRLLVPHRVGLTCIMIGNCENGGVSLPNGEPKRRCSFCLVVLRDIICSERSWPPSHKEVQRALWKVKGARNCGPTIV